MLDRVFLGSGGPLLPALAGWVIDQHVDGLAADCSSHVLVLPTGRARRRLEQLLLNAAADRNIRLIPPELTTPSGLLGHFLVPDLPSADTLTSQLAWLHAIQSASQDELKFITGHSNPLTAREAVALAARLQKLMYELGAGGYTPAEAMQESMKAGLPLEEDRWAALDSLWSRTTACLNGIGQVDPNTARREALDEGRLFTGEARQVSIVSADPSPLLARLLDTLDEAGLQINSIIHGEANQLETLFDRFGGVDIDSWNEQAIDLSNHEVVTCDRVDDQIAVVLEHLADRTEAEGEVSGGSTTVIVPDEELLPLMERHLHRQGVPVPPTTTRPMDDGRLGRLLIILANLLEDQRARHHGDLLRHPDVEEWMIQQGIEHPVARWDELWNRHLPRSLDDLAVESRAECHFNDLLKPLLELISPLQGAPRSACEWARSIMETVGTLVASSDVPLGSQDSRALRILRESLESQLDLYGTGMHDVTASDLIRLLVEQLRAAKSSRPDSDAISLIGWLDAHLDDAPDLVITGLNENTIPAGASTDPWLPEPVRELLGLSSQRKRTARDAWLLSATLQSGRKVKLVTARRASKGDPLVPSRLLLRTSGPALAEQVLKLSGDPGLGREPELTRWRSLAESDSGFHEDPIPTGEPVIRHISVTAFKRYLNDPYNFMLERDERTRISSIETLDSLDHAGFGSLVHDVLEKWGHQEHDRDQPTMDAAVIEADLIEALRVYALARFGEQPIAPVRLQLAIAAQRLSAFAPHQAAHAAAGWRIHLVEANFGPRGYPEPMFPGPDGLLLRGKIDRVDRHDDHGFMAVDYKTGSSVDSPRKAHQSGSNWKDLQLPLYRFLLDSIDLPVSPSGLGYVLLPPDSLHTGFHLAAWQEKDMASAMEAAREIVEVITSGNLLSLIEGESS